MSLFTDDPSLLLPAFEPRFAIRRLIVDRGGIYDRTIADGRLNTPPSVLVLDSVHATLLAIDPLVAALAFAGYDAREIVIGTSHGGDAGFRGQGSFRVSMRSGLGHAEAGDWSVLRHIDDPGTFHNIVAIRVVAWRQPTKPTMQIVDLASVDAYQTYRDPDDDWGDTHDGWILLGSADPVNTSQTAGKAVPAVLGQVVAAIQSAVAGNPNAGLARILNPATWSVPRERDALVPSLLAIAETIWLDLEDNLNQLSDMIGLSDPDTPTMDDITHQTDVLLFRLGEDWKQLSGDLTDELERRRLILQPREGQLSDVIAKVATLHWPLVVMQLHEFGLIDVLPLPPPDPPTPAAAPAIPVIDLTGFYQSIPDATGDYGTSMQLNQAGAKIRGYWLDEELGVWPLEGTYNTTPADGYFEFDLVSTFDGSTGTLYRTPPPTIDGPGFGVYVVWADSPSLIYGMARQDRKGRISPGDIVRQLGREDSLGQLEPLLHPLNAGISGRIMLMADSLFEQIRFVTSVLFDDAHLAVETMNDTVVDLAIDKDLARREGDDFALTPLLVRVRVELRNFLARQPVPEAADVGAWFQLESIVALYPDESVDLRALLAIGINTHNYDFTLEGSGVEAGGQAILAASGGGFSIKSTFTHKDTCDGPDVDPDWSDVYYGAMLVGGGGIGLGGGADAILAFQDLGTNDLDPPDEWLRDDFLCMFVNGELARSVSYGIGGAAGEAGSESEGYTFFRGRDGAQATGRGGGDFIGFGLGAKLGGSETLTGQWGMYVYREGDPPPVVEPPPELAVDLRGANSDVRYFDIDKATLTPEGKQVIHDLALTYRPLLDDAGSYLVIEGDASRTGSTQHNLDLSRNRALAVHDYLRSLLTAPAIGSSSTSRPCSSLAITDSHIIISARGESRAEIAKLDDEVESAEWRRTTMVLIGRFAGTFKAAGVFVSPEDQ